MCLENVAPIIAMSMLRMTMLVKKVDIRKNMTTSVFSSSYQYSNFSSLLVLSN